MHGTYTLDTFEGTTFWSGGGGGGGGHGISYELWLFNLVPRLSGSHSQALLVSFPGSLGLIPRHSWSGNQASS